MRRMLVALALVAAAVPWPSVRPTAQRRPNVLLVTLDTTRADRMGFLGSMRGLTPSLDALARESVVFTRAYAQAPITTVSHATILTGTFPPFHHVNDFGMPLGESIPYLPEVFRRAGYRTGAFVGSLILDPRSGTAPGFDRGFDVYDAGFRMRRPGEDRYRTIERRGDIVVANALKWVGAGGDKPFFLWTHLYDPHDPYDPPAPLKRKYASAPYDGEIAWVDELVGRLLAGLKANALLDNTVIVVAADHGEALGDHGEEAHGLFLYDSTLHVPFVVRLPDRRDAGAHVSARVRLADVAPTILAAAGVAVPPTMQGASALSLVGGRGGASGSDADRPAYAETEYPRRGFGWSPLVSWRADRFLYVRAPRRELYDVTADAAEMKNLAEPRARVADAMDRELQAFVGRVGGSGAPGSSAKPTVDPDLASRLAALGYVSGSGAPPSNGVDPKDRVAIANALHDAVVEVEDGEFQKATPLLEKVTASEPDIPLAQLHLGIARSQQRQYARAIAPLRKAISLQPDLMLAHYELGVALYETGDLKTAAGHFEIVTTRMPKWADARYSLGSVYARIDRVPDAMKELRAALALEPRHFRANLLLGRILALSGQAPTAVPYLKTATDVDPANAEAHVFLADAYEKSGNHQSAEEERQRAQKLQRSGRGG